jgi:miniconductance mechanosensitive channel
LYDFIKKNLKIGTLKFCDYPISPLIPFGTFLCREKNARMFKFIENIWLFLSNTRKWDIGYSTASYLSLFNINAIMRSGIHHVCGVSPVLVTVMIFIACRTKTKFDDLLSPIKLAKYIAHLIPLLFIYKSVPVILQRYGILGRSFGKIS